MEQHELSAGPLSVFAGDPEALRVVAEVAAAAGEGDVHRLILAVSAPLKRLIPEPVASFGLLDGDKVVFPDPMTDAVRHTDSRLRLVAELGQVTAPGHMLPRTGMLANLEVPTFSLTVSKVGGRILGYFFVASLDQTFTFTERELAVLRVVAQIVGPAVEHAWQTQRMTEGADEQRVVAAVAAVAARGGSPDQVVEALREALQPLIEAPFVSYAHRTGSGYAWYGAGAPIPTSEASAEGPPRPGEGVHAEVLEMLAANGVHRFTLTPVTVESAPAGFLLAGSRSPRYEFNARHRGILGVVAQIVGPAVANALANLRLQEEAQEQRALAVVAAAAAREADGLHILESVRSTLAGFVPDPCVSFAYVHGERVVFLRPEAGLEGRQLTGLERRALVEGQQQATAPGLADEGATPASVVITATHAGGEAHGLLTVSCADPGYAYGERTLRVIRLVAEIVGPALANARAASATARERALYELILESLDEAVLLFDDDLKPSYGNRRATELFGAIAQSWEDLSRAQRLALLPGQPRDQLLAAIGAGSSRSGRTRFPLRRDVWVDYEFLPLDHPEYRLIAVAEDVSAEVAAERERKRQQDQLQQAARLAALGELVSGVAHELNNPLTAILGFSESLMTAADAEPLMGDLEVIQKEALRARNIVRDLLFVVRPGPVERHEVDLGAVARHVERLRRAAWDQAGFSVSVEAHPGTVVLGNEHQLVQVVLNLVTNAEQALDGRNDPRLAIAVGVRPGCGASIEVRDNGGGIDDDVRPRLFEPFFTTKQGIGTGLGLSLCHSIVKAHGGTIEVRSPSGGGAVFRVEFPPAPVAAADVEALAVGTRDRPARVVVVDDEPSIRTITKRVVRAIGHECEAAADVASALALVDHAEFDLLICDYRLGHETALAIIDHLAVTDPAALERTVLTTGATTDEGVLALVEAHGLRILPKPFGRKDLEGLLAARAA